MMHGEFDISFSKKAQANPELATQTQAFIDFSIKVVDALGLKAKGYNSKFGKKISISQLKKVYTKGAHCRSDDARTNGEWAMARVNMFLRLISSNTFKDALAKKNGGISISNLEIDVTENWSPSEEDFAQASVDIAEFKLEYDFKDVEELYLNENPARFSFEV